MYDHFWGLVIPLLRKSKIVVSTPYVWDAKGRRFVLIKNAKYVRRFNIISCIIYAHMIIMAWNVFQVLKKENSLLLQTTSLGIAGLAMFATVTRWMHQTNAAAIVQFLNRMVAFQISSTERGNDNELSYTNTVYVPNLEIKHVLNKLSESKDMPRTLWGVALSQISPKFHT
jgi:hypothetical protein